MSGLLEFFGIVKDPLVGLDISSTAVKLLQISKDSKDKLTINNYGIEPLAKGAVIEKNIKDKSEVTRAIKKLVEKCKLDSRYIVSSVPSAAAITRVVQLDEDLTEKDIANEIELEADRYIPYPLDEVNLDFEVLGPAVEHPTLVNVLVAASKKEHVGDRLDVIQDANLIPYIMDIDSFAMERAFTLVQRQLPRHANESLIGMVDLGATTTTLDVFQNGNSIYTREQSFGGQQLSNEIENRYGLSHEEAMLATKYSDLPEDYITEVLEPFKSVVAQQVVRACEFFYSASEHSVIEYLFLTGGTCCIQGLDILIQEQSGIKTFLANPFSNMQFAKSVSQEVIHHDAPFLMNCCGLALRNIYQ